MTDFAGFEAREPLAEGPVASTYVAVPRDGRAGAFVLERFHPPPAPSIQRFLAVEGWLLAAERQQRAGRAGAPVVEVVACGRDPETGGAWAVRVRSGPSLEGLVAILEPAPGVVRAMARGVLRALEDWEKSCGEPHGQVAPGNLHPSGDGPLERRRFLLGHPAFVPGTPAVVRRRRELADLGRLLVRLVGRRDPTGWPIETAPEWRRLGRSGAAWLALCNDLLDPHADGEPPTPADLLRRIDRIPRERPPARTAALAAGALVVVGAGGLAGYARFADASGLPDRLLPLAEKLGNPTAVAADPSPEWLRLCGLWTGWLAEFTGRIEALLAVPDLWGGPEDPLRASLVGLEEMAERLDPRSMDPDFANRNVADLAADPPPAARTERVARLARDSLQRALESAVQLTTWPQWEAWEAAAAEFEQRGWSQAARELRALVPPRGAEGRDAAASADALVQAVLRGRDAVTLAARWRQLGLVRADLEAAGDPVLAGLADLQLADVTDDGLLDDPGAAFGPARQVLAGALARWRAEDLDRERFAREAVTRGHRGPVTPEVVARWDEEVRAFTRLPAAEDPRAAEGWTQRAAALQASAAELEPEPGAAAPGEEAVLDRPGFERELALLQRRVDDLQQQRPLRRDLPAVRGTIEELRAAFGELERRVETALASQRPDRWLRQVAERTWIHPATARLWQEWQDVALAGQTAASLQADRARFRALRGSERTARAWLAGLEGPAGVGGVPPPEPAGVAAEVAEAVLALAAARRDALVVEVARAGGWNPPAAPGTWEETAARPAVAGLLDGARAWARGAAAWARTLDGLGRLLADGFGWSEGVGDALVALEREQGLDGLRGPPAGWLAEARRLRDLAGATDRGTLVAAARDESLPVRLTAWRRLGALPGWPTTVEELDTDGALVEGLRSAFAARVPAGARRQALEGEVAQETRRRWNRAAAAAAAGGEAALATVFGRMDRFGLGEGDLEPPVAYNYRLWGLRGARMEDLDIPVLARMRDDFVAAAEAAPEVAAAAGVGDFLRRLRAIELVEDDRGAVVAPFRAGWREEYPDNGARAVARWSGGGREFEMPWVRVLPDDATPPFYIAARAVSVGEFVELVARRSEGREVLAAMPRWIQRVDARAPQSVPLAWRPEEGGRALRVADEWIFNPSPPVLEAMRPGPDGRPALLAGGPVPAPPGPALPMQFLPPEAARLFAERVLGARLPRPEEWRALARQYGGAIEGNLRDQAFAATWSHVGGLGIDWRPDAGRFGAGRGGAGGEAWPGRSDDVVWFTPVDTGPAPGGIRNLFGNVATYLFDPAAGAYFVAGGSALSPPDLDPRQPQPVEVRRLIGVVGGGLGDGFSDVGLRPAFDLSPGLRARFELVQLVCGQPFLVR